MHAWLGPGFALRGLFEHGLAEMSVLFLLFIDLCTLLQLFLHLVKLGQLFGYLDRFSFLGFLLFFNLRFRSSPPGVLLQQMSAGSLGN